MKKPAPPAPIGFHMHIDPELHQAAKIAAAQQRVTLRKFVEDLLRKAVNHHKGAH